jgi:N-acetyl sugar amidotransferase
MPDTRPDTVFSEEGLCPTCSYSVDSKQVDFSRRLEELEELIEPLIRAVPAETGWPAIVGVSGGKDSTRQALWVRERLGIEPLLVSASYPSRQVSEEGVRNIENLVGLGFTVEQIFVAPKLARKLFKIAFHEFGNAFKATEIVLFSSVQKFALRRQIPIIFWGETGALIGDMATEGASIWDGNRLRHTNTLRGGDIQWIESATKQDMNINFYKFPPEELMASAINVIFLSPAWPDWTSHANSLFSLMHGFEFSNFDSLESGDLLNTEMIDEHFVMINNLLRYYKFGFGRASEQVSQLVRAGKLSRDEAIEIAEEFDSKFPQEALSGFLRYIECSSVDFWKVVQKFGNTVLFDFSSKPPKPLFRVGSGLT